jgi:hypothetical protein
VRNKQTKKLDARTNATKSKNLKALKTLMSSIAIRVVEISIGVYKIRKILPKNQHTKRKLLNFVFWINGELSKSAKI